MTESQAYQCVPGTEHSQVYGDAEIYIPPQWVIDRLALPQRYAHASLAKQMREYFNPDLYATCEAYVMEWTGALKYGEGAVFAGTSGGGKTFAAAAVANEITRVYGQVRHIQIVWFPVASKLQELLRFERFGMKEEYFNFRKRLLNADLVIVDDLTHAANRGPTKDLLFELYDERYQRQAPIVTTGNFESIESLEKVFDSAFARRLSDTSAHFSVHL